VPSALPVGLTGQPRSEASSQSGGGITLSWQCFTAVCFTATYIVWLLQFGMTEPHSAGQGKLDFEAERVRLKAQNTEVVTQLQHDAEPLHAANAKSLKVHH